MEEYNNNVYMYNYHHIIYSILNFKLFNMKKDFNDFTYTKLFLLETFEYEKQ